MKTVCTKNLANIYWPHVNPNVKLCKMSKVGRLNIENKLRKIKTFLERSDLSPLWQRKVGRCNMWCWVRLLLLTNTLSALPVPLMAAKNLLSISARESSFFLVFEPPVTLFQRLFEKVRSTTQCRLLYGWWARWICFHELWRIGSEWTSLRASELTILDNNWVTDVLQAN